MSIRVTCPGCHTRFQVSERFAGQTGACPKCKHGITIPGREQEVKIHEPENYGPKSGQGREVLKPLFRREARVTGVHVAITVGLVVTAVALAILLRVSQDEPRLLPMWMSGLAALVIAIATSYGGYLVLRDVELAPLRGNQLWARILACAAIYALLWLAMPLAAYAMNAYDIVSWGIAVVAMMALGTLTAMLALELQPPIGLVHYGIYFAACVVLRWIAGVGPLPGMIQEPTPFDIAALASNAVPHLAIVLGIQ